jgi:WhiB family redox-sensing transcriptional regulator
MGKWSWQDDAACSEMGLVLFFGGTGEGPSARDVRERKATAICGGCRARIRCLNHALSLPEKDGIWGGMTEDERASERRRRQRRGQRESVTRPEIDDVPDKRCRVCEEVKPATDYGPARQNADGLNSACKSCTARMARERRLARAVAS